MHILPGLVALSVVIGAIGLVGCKKDEGDKTVTPEVTAVIDAAAAPVTPTEPSAERHPPTPVEDAPDEYKAIAELVVAELAKKDFDSFVKNAMVSTEELQAMMEKGWEACSGMAPTEEQREQAKQALAEYYDPAGAEVRARFDSCVAKHDFAKATYKEASSREHVSMCRVEETNYAEAADHVELKLTVGNEEVVVVLDDLVKTDAGWRLADVGLSCPDKQEE